MQLSWTTAIGIIKLTNAAIMELKLLNAAVITCNNSEMGRGEMGRKKTGANKILKCRCLRQRQLKKIKNQMPLSCN